MCGSPMGDNQKSCICCDYVEKTKKVKLCPDCGETLTRGVCYRCGYRSKFSKNTCPYCRQRLIAGRCKDCKYVEPSRLLKAYVFDVLLIAFILLFLYIKFLK